MSEHGPGVPDLETVDRMPVDLLPAFLTMLSALQARAAARLMARAPDVSPAPAETHLLTVREAAARCGMSADWLYRHSERLPFVRRIGRSVRFEAAGLARWMKQSR